MRGLQVKQSPIVRFMYDQHNLHQKPISTLPKKMSQPLINHSISPLKVTPNIQSSYQQQSSPQTISRGKDETHIKIVDLMSQKRIETSSKRQRRHKIFESVDKLKDRGSSHEKAEVVVKQVQIKQPVSIIKQPFPVVYAPPVVVSCKHEGSELKLANQLLSKSHEIRYLKMQVERFKRCERLSRQNEQIYKRLVEKITGESNQDIHQSSHKIQQEQKGDSHGHTRRFINPNRGFQQQKENMINFGQEQESAAQQKFEMSSSQKDYAYRARQSQTLPIMGIADISPVLENIFNQKTIPGRYEVNEFDCPIIDSTSNAITFNKQFPKAERPRYAHKKIAHAPKREAVSHIRFQLTDLNKNLQSKCRDYTLSRLIQRGSNLHNSFTERSRSISHQSRLAVPLFF